MTNTQKVHQLNLAAWASRFQEQKASGLSAKSWCDQNNISIHTYNYWKHLVKQEVLDTMLSPTTPEIVPIVPQQFPIIPNAPKNESSFVSNNSHELYELSDSRDSNFIKIELPGICISLDAFSIDRAISILKAVRHA